MSEDSELEREILEYVAAWSEDKGRPSNSVPFVFPEVLSNLPLAQQNHVSSSMIEDRLRRKLDEMTAARLLLASDLIGDDTWAMTREGYIQLEKYRDMRGWRWWHNQVSKWADRIFASILTPILVSILTVLVMQYLGLKE